MITNDRAQTIEYTIDHNMKLSIITKLNQWFIHNSEVRNSSSRHLDSPTNDRHETSI